MIDSAATAHLTDYAGCEPRASERCVARDAVLAKAAPVSPTSAARKMAQAEEAKAVRCRARVCEANVRATRSASSVNIARAPRQRHPTRRALGVHETRGSDVEKAPTLLQQALAHVRRAKRCSMPSVIASRSHAGSSLSSCGEKTTSWRCKSGRAWLRVGTRIRCALRGCSRHGVLRRLGNLGTRSKRAGHRSGLALDAHDRFLRLV
jgi:hypothetical protein